MKNRKSISVIVWDLYPAFGNEGERGYKRAAYNWSAGVAWLSIWRWLFAQHGNTDLRYTVMQDGKPMSQGTFAHY